MNKKFKEIKILKINNDGLLTIDFQEFIAVINILKNQHKQFLIPHKKSHIFKEKIWDCIRQYHNPIEYKHERITNTIKAIQQNCHFEEMKKYITKFIKQYNNCQKNKHSTHKKYGIMQIIPKPKKQ